MERDLNIDYEALKKNRFAKRLVYNAIRTATILLGKRYLNTHVEGKENIPRTSAIIATHHCVNFDWALMLNILGRRCHGWFDDAVMKTGGHLERFFEIIPVKTDKTATKNDIRRTKELSRYWLENTNEFVVSVTDGPSKLLLREDKTVMDLSERPIHSGLVSVAFDTGVAVVPYASWIPEKHREALFASKGILKDIDYLEEHRKIPYRGMFSTPLYSANFRGKKTFEAALREKQIEMEAYLKRL
jgi:1-acyl-sn-glycerol-3-phosphate acyltransferase